MNILKRIIKEKKLSVEESRNRITLDELKNKARKKKFFLQRALNKKDRIHLIAEIKKASPSRGVIKNKFDPIALAKIYKKSGVSAISVLTEEKFFLGSLDTLKDIKRNVKCCVLRKDFIIDEYQVYESAVFGADAILLIARILPLKKLLFLKRCADGLGLDSLVEVHDENDLSKALSINAKIIGVNNRDLATLKIDLNKSVNLAKHIKKKTIVISESGIRNSGDIKRLKSIGINCFLVGESLLKSKDIKRKVKELTLRLPC
ncbi:MAG: indole-3-glycerol phosphate synthase TrpC [bacterium]